MKDFTTITECIEALKSMPQDAEMAYLYDMEARGSVRSVYLAKSGLVVLTAGGGAVAYSSEDWPVGTEKIVTELGAA